MLSVEAVEKAVEAQSRGERSRISTPSLIIMDYQIAETEEFRLLSLLKNQQALAGVPVFFMVEERSRQIDESCYAHGAMVVLTKPFVHSDIVRMQDLAINVRCRPHEPRVFLHLFSFINRGLWRQLCSSPLLII